MISEMRVLCRWKVCGVVKTACSRVYGNKALSLRRRGGTGSEFKLIDDGASAPRMGTGGIDVCCTMIRSLSFIPHQATSMCT